MSYGNPDAYSSSIEAYYTQMYEDWCFRWEEYHAIYGIYIEADRPVVKSDLTIEVN